MQQEFKQLADRMKKLEDEVRGNRSTSKAVLSILRRTISQDIFRETVQQANAVDSERKGFVDEFYKLRKQHNKPLTPAPTTSEPTTSPAPETSTVSVTDADGKVFSVARSALVQNVATETTKGAPAPTPLQKMDLDTSGSSKRSRRMKKSKRRKSDTSNGLTAEEQATLDLLLKKKKRTV